MAIAGAAGTTKGVDSTAQSEDALEAGKALARETKCIVAITGATDLVGLHVCALAAR
jgi:hydroxyethylthiazole kinase